MQNFTLGKKGISMLFFAFILLIGSSPTFGQQSNCPTVSNTSPDPFCYLDDISDLTAESGAQGGTEGLRWYRTANATNPISNDEFLESGTYFAGNNSGSCDNRISVSVTVTDIGAPSADFGNFFQPCEYAADDTSTVQDLIDNVTATDNSYTIEVFEDEFGTTALNPATPLVSGSNVSYFIGQRDPAATPNCPSSRIAVSYDPILAEAPTGAPEQTFCPGATVSDLQASFTSPDGQAIRWYSTMDSQPPLNANTPLINGETYYASQIVNRQNSTLPPCESTMRFEVEVDFDSAVLTSSTQSFCVDSDDPSTTPTVSDLTSPFGNPFFADEDFTQLLDGSTALINNEDYYTASGDANDCLAEVVTVDFIETPNAGSDVDETICETELADPSDLIAEFTALLQGRDLGGTFSDSDVTELLAQYNLNPIGTFTTTYTVTNGQCEDSAVISVTVQATTPADAGTIENIELCQSTGSTDLYSLLGLDSDDRGIFTDENDDEIVDGNFTPSTLGIFPVTYTVSAANPGTACISGSDSEEFDIAVNMAGPVMVGNINDVATCLDGETIDLAELLNSTNSTLGGTFTGDGVSNGMFDPSEAGIGEYLITYSVNGDDSDCITGADSGTFTIIVDAEASQAEVGPIANQTTCIDGENIFLPGLLNTANTTQGGTFNGTGVSDNIFDPSEAGEGVFTITYSVSGDDSECIMGSASGTFTITVDAEASQAMVGAIENQDTCIDNETITLSTLLNSDTTTPGGNFTGTGVTDGIFDPSEAGEGTFTITYSVSGDDSACILGEASGTFTITVGMSVDANAGEDRDLVFCTSEEDIILRDFLMDANPNGLFSGEGVTNGMFSPSSTGAGNFTITYTVTDEANCVIEGTSDTATFDITVNEPTEANAGGNQTPPAYCGTDDQDIDLATLLGEGANPLGSFEIDGEEVTSFNPAELGEGEFVFTYSIDENDCAIGTDSATITINVTARPEAPVANSEQSFCLIDNPTVASMDATGDNVILYTDEALTQEAIESDPLANNAVYYAVATSGDNGCTSEAVMITISLTDGTAPTLSIEGNEFCRSDDPTIQDLINNLNGSGIQIYQASTGGTALAVTTALQDGATYFASATNAEGCESSERLGVQVEVAFCGIPEAFSPNGDNINDRFVIPEIAIDFPNYTIEIFNRWGNVVFKGNSSTGDWDGVSNQSGTLGDNVLAAGVYFYILNYNDGQTAPVQGKVYLSR